MQNSLLHVVWTEMCLDSVSTRQPYNDKKSTQCFFLNNDKSWPLSKIKPFSDSWLCDVTQAKAPPTTVDWHWCFTLDPPWSVRHCFDAGAGRPEWLLSYWGVLLLDVIMNIAVVIYSRHLSRSRRCGLCLFLKGMCPPIYLNAFVRANHSWSSLTSRRSEYTFFFFNEFCKSPFLIMC